MPIRFNCDDCGKDYKVSSQYAGKKVKCKKCGTKMRVPGGEDSKPASKRSSTKEPSQPSKRVSKRSSTKEPSKRVSKRSSSKEPSQSSKRAATKGSSARRETAKPSGSSKRRGTASGGAPTTGTQVIDVEDITPELKRYARKKQDEKPMPRGKGRMVYFKKLKPIKSFRIDGDDITVGRDDSCDVTIPEESVSSSHIRIEVKLGRFIAVDQRSCNGLLVNGRKVRRASLKNGDVLQLGEAILRIDCA